MFNKLTSLVRGPAAGTGEPTPAPADAAAAAPSAPVVGAAPAAGAPRTYEDRVASQVQQFKGGVNHVDAAMRAAWQQRYLKPKIQEVFDAGSHVETYVKELARAHAAFRAAGGTGRFRFASVGCGDCALEISIAQGLLRNKVTDFTLTGLEISPLMVKLGTERAAAAGVGHVLEVVESDANGALPDEEFGAVIAHHALHHIVNLEGLFDWIAAKLRPEGVFLTFDTIGRNGHQMWPEAKFYVDRFWTLLPERLRYDLVWKKVADTYLDWDCSSKGFEGIRAQDILPLLAERFEFEKFLGYGGLTDPFLGRRFAGNFDLDSEFDRGVLELLENTNDALLRSGALKPTRMAAVMRPKGTPVQQRTWGGLDAKRSVRDPDTAPVMAVLIQPQA